LQGLAGFEWNRRDAVQAFAADIKSIGIDQVFR
jgi:hypothetical protein